MEHNVGDIFIAQRLAIEQDHGGLRVDLHVGGGGGLAVHENAALPAPSRAPPAVISCPLR